MNTSEKNIKTYDNKEIPSLEEIQNLNSRLISLRKKASDNPDYLFELPYLQAIGLIFQSNPGQSGSLLQKLACLCFGFENKNSPNGDAVDKIGDIIEIKGSFSTEVKACFRFNQIRNYHNFDKIIFIGIDTRNNSYEPYVFVLDKNQCKEEVSTFGGSTHGSEHKAGSSINLTPNKRSPHFRRWMDKYYNPVLSAAIRSWPGLRGP